MACLRTQITIKTVPWTLSWFMWINMNIFLCIKFIPDTYLYRNKDKEIFSIPFLCYYFSPQNTASRNSHFSEKPAGRTAKASFLWMLYKMLLTIRGLKGGLIFLCSRRTQSISLKNGCCLIASSPFCDATQPSRLLGFFVMNYRVGRERREEVKHEWQ